MANTFDLRYYLIDNPGAKGKQSFERQAPGPLWLAFASHPTATIPIVLTMSTGFEGIGHH